VSALWPSRKRGAPWRPTGNLLEFLLVVLVLTLSEKEREREREDRTLLRIHSPATRINERSIDPLRAFPHAEGRATMERASGVRVASSRVIYALSHVFDDVPLSLKLEGLTVERDLSSFNYYSLMRFRDFRALRRINFRLLITQRDPPANQVCLISCVVSGCARVFIESQRLFDRAVSRV